MGEAAAEISTNIEGNSDKVSKTELFHSILGLISLEVIESLTTFSGGGKKDPLVDQMMEFLGLDRDGDVPKKRGKAKILPFKRDNLAPPIEGNSTSCFIYKEKKELEKVQKKIKEREVVQLYEKSAKVNVKQERSLKDDLSKSYKVGVLIDKRQY
jgi:hypothetical protein